MADKKDRSGTIFLLVIGALLAAMFAETQFGIFSGCDWDCTNRQVKAEVKRCSQILDALDLSSEELREEAWRIKQGEGEYCD